MFMKRFLKLLSAVSVVAAFALTACQPETIPVSFADEDAQGEVGYADLPVFVDVELGRDAGTKASLLNGCESKSSGALVLVYRSATGSLETSTFFTAAQLAAQTASSPLTVPVPLAKCDFYIVGNLNAIHKTSGTAADLATALATDFPMTETALESLVYRLDGGDVNGTYRRERMAEIATYGIPYYRIEKNVDCRALVAAGSSLPNADKCIRLFSRIELTIDHSLFDGGTGAADQYFVNNSVYIRQANVKLMPFSAASVKASAAADLSSSSNPADYDAAMSNANAGTYVFYVPENMQGAASGVTSGAQKNKTNTGIAQALRDYGTFVEFTGTLGPKAGGFTGEVTYQFYLGANNTTDFNLQRGKKYAVTLSFTSGSLFGTPTWKVDADLTDNRLFALTADAANTTDIGSVNTSRILAVRKNRPGAMYVYMNTAGSLGGTNALLGKDVTAPASFSMSDMSDCSWYGDFMTPGTADYNWLAARGIAASWDKTAGRLVFTVTDESRFTVGDSRTFTLSLLPTETQTTSFTLRLQDNLGVTVADGKSLTDEFYIGQKRTVTVTGFTSSPVKYAAVQEGCGEASKTNTQKNSNRQWKTVNTGDFASGYPSCAVDASGNVVLNPSNTAYASQSCSGSLDIYAWYPNRFQGSHSGWSSKNGRIVFFTEDWLNDSAEAVVRISEPRYRGFVYDWTGIGQYALNLGLRYQDKELDLCIDGNEVTSSTPVYQNYAGTVALDYPDFDSVLYDKLLLPALSTDGSDVDKTMLKGVFIEPDGDMYVRSTLVDGLKFEEQDYSYTGFLSHNNRLHPLGNCVVSANPSTGLFSGTTDLKIYISSFEVWNIVGGSTVNNLWPGLKLEFSFYTHMGNADLSRLDFGFIGPCSKYVSNSGTVYGPEYTVGDLTRLGCTVTLDTDDAVKYEGAEAIPGELLLPYGEQKGGVFWKNKWDGRRGSATRDFSVKYAASLIPFFVFSGNKYLYFRIGSLLSIRVLMERGGEMTQDGRRLCLDPFGVDIEPYFKAYKFVERDDHNWQWGDSSSMVRLTSNGFRYDFYSGDFESSGMYYYDGTPAFSWPVWTRDAARHFMTDLLVHSDSKNYFKWHLGRPRSDYSAFSDCSFDWPRYTFVDSDDNASTFISNHDELNEVYNSLGSWVGLDSSALGEFNGIGEYTYGGYYYHRMYVWLGDVVW